MNLALWVLRKIPYKPFLANRPRSQHSGTSEKFLFRLCLKCPSSIISSRIYKLYSTFSFLSSVQSLSHVWLFGIPWTAARQASLSITNSQSCSKSSPLSWWCPPIISSSVVPFSCLQSWALFPQSSVNHVCSCIEHLIPPLEIFFLWGFSWVENLTCVLQISCCPISRLYSKDLSLSRWITFNIVSNLSKCHVMLFANWIHLFPNWILTLLFSFAHWFSSLDFKYIKILISCFKKKTFWSQKCCSPSLGCSSTILHLQNSHLSLKHQLKYHFLSVSF